MDELKKHFFAVWQVTDDASAMENFSAINFPAGFRIEAFGNYDITSKATAFSRALDLIATCPCENATTLKKLAMSTLKVYEI